MLIAKRNARVVQHVYAVLEIPVEIQVKSRDELLGEHNKHHFGAFEPIFVEVWYAYDIAGNRHHKRMLLDIVRLKIKVYLEMAFLQKEYNISVEADWGLKSGEYLGVPKCAFSACFSHDEVSSERIFVHYV